MHWVQTPRAREYEHLICSWYSVVGYNGVIIAIAIWLASS
jgi:hypothetical protein